ncbi:MAG: single-stranded DNA-binding protein [bacterium]|nr:single-stranded DNA-binding protein [bacterium]
MAGKSLNKVQIIGNLGKDPELKYTASGVAVATFSVATNYRTQDQSTNEWKDNTEWHNVVAWRKLGEIAGEYLSKGGKVYIEGRLQTRTWDDQQGVKHYMTEIVAQELILLGGRGDSGGGNYPPHPADTMTAQDSTGPSQTVSPQQSAPTHTGASAAAPAVNESSPTVNEPPADDIPF